MPRGMDGAQKGVAAAFQPIVNLWDMLCRQFYPILVDDVDAKLLHIASLELHTAVLACSDPFQRPWRGERPWQ